MSARVSGLPRFLTTHAGQAGFGQIQRAAAAVETEIRHLANPIALDPIAVPDGIEDQASMAPRAVAKVSSMVWLFTHLTAIELVAAAQAAELRGVVPSMGVGAREAFEMARRYNPAFDQDRALGPEVSLLVDAIRAC